MSRNNDIRRSMLTELLEGQPARKKQKTSITAPVSTLLLNGQRAMEDKRFNDAVSSFSDAIASISDRKADLLHLYDLRATAYVKLGNPDSALKDAKQMIRLDRVDHRGYLKCAQIERSRGNLKEAVRLCEYGLSSIGSNDKMRQSLEAYVLRLREAQKSQVIFEKGTDPMEVLPSELLALVLSYFNYREVIAIMRVCKAWRNRLRATDLVTQSIDTRSTRKTLKHEHIKTAFNRLGRNPRKIAVSKLNENAAFCVAQELQSWIRWESIRVLSLEDAKITIPRLRYEKFESLREISFKQVTFQLQSVNEVLQSCPVLEHAVFVCNFTSPASHRLVLQPVNKDKLQTLVISHARPTERFNLKLDNINPISPNLEHLEIANAMINDDADLSMHTKLTDVVLRDTKISDRYYLLTPSTLQSFQMDGHFMNVYPQPEQIRMPASNISTLDLKGEHSIRCLLYLIRQGLSRVQLRSLAMTAFVFGSNVGGRHFHQSLGLLTTIPGKEELSNVESLSLKDDNIHDDEQSTIFGLFPNVKYLELESQSITEQIITEHIKSKNSVLKSVVFRNCPRVSAEIDKWARTRQVEVKHIRQSVLPLSIYGGRRVRYE